MCTELIDKDRNSDHKYAQECRKYQERNRRYFKNKDYMDFIAE